MFLLHIYKKEYHVSNPCEGGYIYIKLSNTYSRTLTTSDPHTLLGFTSFGRPVVCNENSKYFLQKEECDKKYLYNECIQHNFASKHTLVNHTNM